MSSFNDALRRLAQQEEINQSKAKLLSTGMDSTVPRHVQILDSMRRNETYSAVSASVDYEDPTTLDRVVSAPGRMAHSIAKGFVDSSGDMIELPERIVNYVGNQLGWDDDDRISVLSNVAESVRDSVDYADARETIENKIAYYVGYAIPDLIGMALGAGAGKVAAGGLLRAAGRTSVKTIGEKATMAIGRSMGVIGYGTLKGAAFEGAEGAKHAARSFTIMEAGIHALSKFSKPTQVLGTAFLMGSMSATSIDPSRPDYEDEVIANAVLGGMFAAVSKKQQGKILKDANVAKDKMKAFIAKERAEGREPNMNDVALEFIERDWQYLHKAVRKSADSVDPYSDLIKNIELEVGEGTIKSPRDATQALTGILTEGGDMNPLDAMKFADSFVKTAEFLSNPETPKGPSVLKDFVDIHKHKLASAVDADFQVHEGSTVLGPMGTKVKAAPATAEAVKMEVAKSEIKFRNIEQLEQKQTMSTLEKAYAGYDALTNPEGRVHAKLVDFGIVGKKIHDLVKARVYDSFDMGDAWSTKAKKAVKFDTFVGEQKTVLDNLVRVTMMEDRFTRDAFYGKERVHEWTPEQTRLIKEDAHNWIRENEGVDGFNRYETAIEEIMRQQATITKLKYVSGIISKKTYENYTRPKFLPENRAIRWIKTMPFAELESSVLAHNDPIFKEAFGFTKTDPFAKKHDVDPIIHDSEYLLSTYIKRSHYAAAKNNLLRGFHEAAQSNVQGLLDRARMPIKRYKIKGTREFLDEKRVTEILASNEKLDIAAKNVKAERKRLREEFGIEGGGKEKKAPSVNSLLKHIETLKKEIEKEEQRFERFEDHARGDFTRNKVKVSKSAAETIGKENPSEMQKSLIDTISELTRQKEELSMLNKRVILEEVIEPMEGFEAVPFLNKGKVDHVMLDVEAAKMVNTAHDISKLESRILKTLGWVSGTIPVKFIATAINPTFPIRRWWADNLHFFTEYHNKENVISYTKNAFLEQFVRVDGSDKSIFSDVISRGPITERYLLNGGSKLMMTKMVQEELLFRRVGDIMKTGKARGLTGWERFTEAASWLGTNIELTIRVHQFQKLLNAGKTPREAVRIVNDHLNFSRKGHYMRTIDSVYPFANVAAQAFDAQVRSFKQDPILATKKLAQYTAMRTMGLWVGYTLMGTVMDQVSPYQAVKNWIIPTGLTTQDINGDTQHGYIAIPTENSPFFQAIDALLVGSARIMRDQTDTLGFEEILERLSDSVVMYNVSSFVPTFQAYNSIWKNRDPRTGGNIFYNGGLDSSLHYDENTSNVAKSLGQVIPGASPMGIERVAGMFSSNPITSFGGYLMNDITEEERNSMSRAITEAVPGVKSFMKWTRPRADAAYRMIYEEGSDRQKRVTSFAMQVSHRIKEGDIGWSDAVKQVRQSTDLASLEKQELITNLRTQLRGWEMYKKIQATESPEALDGIPSLREWELMSHQNSQAKARWYLANRPEKDDLSYKPFVKLAKTHGFLNSNKFYYYLRQFEKGGM